MLLVLPNCSKAPPVVRPIDPCPIGAKPKPLDINPQACDNLVCLTIDDTAEIALYIVMTEERNKDIARCPYVKEKTND